jgi:hypothetical protein
MLHGTTGRLEEAEMIVAQADYPLLNVFWTTLVVFGWILWIWLLIRVYGDIFKRRDIGGGAKTAWVVGTILLPLVGCFVYLITQGRSMTERAEQEAVQRRQSFDNYVRSVAGSSDGQDELAKAKGLLDSGVITEQEFEHMTAKVHG